MATGGPPGRGQHLYEEDDLVDEILLNHLSRFVMFNKLPALARHLRIGQAELSRIQGAHTQPMDQTFQVLLKWFHMRVLTVRDLVSEMVEWTRNRYLDPEVWNNFRSKISSAALPANIETLALPAPSGDENDIQPTRRPQPNFHLHNHLHVHQATSQLDGICSLRPNEAIAQSEGTASDTPSLCPNEATAHNEGSETDTPSLNPTVEITHSEGIVSVYLPEDEDPLTISLEDDTSSLSPIVEIAGFTLSLHLPNIVSSISFGTRSRHPPLGPSQPPRPPIPETLEPRQGPWAFHFSHLGLLILLTTHICLQASGLGPAIDQGLNRQSRGTHPEVIGPFNFRLPETFLMTENGNGCLSMRTPCGPDEEMYGDLNPEHGSFQRLFLPRMLSICLLTVCLHTLMYTSRAELDRLRGDQESSCSGSCRRRTGLRRERVDLHGRGEVRQRGGEVPAWLNPSPHGRGGTNENQGQLGAPHGAFEYVVEFVCLVYVLIIIIYELLLYILYMTNRTRHMPKRAKKRKMGNSASKNEFEEPECWNIL